MYGERSTVTLMIGNTRRATVRLSPSGGAEGHRRRSSPHRTPTVEPFLSTAPDWHRWRQATRVCLSRYTPLQSRNEFSCIILPPCHRIGHSIESRLVEERPLLLIHILWPETRSGIHVAALRLRGCVAELRNLIAQTIRYISATRFHNSRSFIRPKNPC